MIPLLLLASLAGAADNESNTFALIFQGLEWATPDLRVELGEGPVRPVLSWPITPVSALIFPRDTRWPQLVFEPYAEPQLRLGAKTTRMLAGSQVLFLGRTRGLGVGFDVAGVHVDQEWGLATGGSLVFSGGSDRNLRGRFSLRLRAYEVGDRRWADLSLDMAAPIALHGWSRIARRQDIDERSLPPRKRREKTEEPDEPHWMDKCGPLGCDELPGCDPIGCTPGMCGESSNGCGGTMYCGDCDELLPACDPMPCMPGMCGLMDDGCGQFMDCGVCEEEILPACDPVGCMPGMCGMSPDGCGGQMFCGSCPVEISECVPARCQPGACGPLPDGCGGMLDCGECEIDECLPMSCQPGTCGAQPDGCGGSIDCGPCGP